MKYTHLSIFPRFLRGGKSAKAVHDLGITLAFGSVLFNGTYNAFAKGLTEILSPISLLILSETLTALLVLLTVGLFPLMRILSKIRGKEFMAAILVGALNSGVGPLLWFQGLSETSAINASLLQGCTLIFILLYGFLFLNERINAMQTIGMLVVSGGIIVITMGQFGMGFSLQPGDGFIILSTAVMALGTVLFKYYLRDLHAEAALFVRNISGILFALSISALIGQPFFSEIRAFPLEQLVLLLSFAFFSRFLNLSFFYGALQRVPATSVALIDHITPLASVFFAVVLLHESIYEYHVLGITFIILGLLIEHISTERVTNITKKVLLFRTSQHHTP